MKDFIIVGGGIAGISFAEILARNGKSFSLITDQSQQSSIVAAGLYNPVILKRLNMPQDAAENLAFIAPFYKEIESKLGLRFDYPMPIYRRFASAEEQNDWFAAADKPALEPFLSVTLRHNHFGSIKAPFGFGEVLRTGFIDTSALISAYLAHLASNGALVRESFRYDALFINKDSVTYNDIEAKHIVFAEGFGISKNPYFWELPLAGTKGEVIVIKAPGLKLNVIIKAGVFILPLGYDYYKVGATYEWEDKTNTPTEAARKELVAGLDDIISCDYTITDQLAGIRPTTKDRKPLIGTHPEHERVHLLNGLGTRGVMLGPPMARELYDAIIHGKPVRKEVNLTRFLS